jgi:hypothetical protein
MDESTGTHLVHEDKLEESVVVSVVEGKPADLGKSCNKKNVFYKRNKAVVLQKQRTL